MPHRVTLSIAVAVSALGVAACARIGDPSTGGSADAAEPTDGGSQCTFEPAPADALRVRVVYLVPSDRTEEPEYTLNLETAAREAQLWVAGQLGGDASFYLGDPVVEVVSTPNPAAYYDSHVAEGCEEDFRFYCNVVDDGLAATGGSYDDPANIWLYYIDADHGCDQLTGGIASVAIAPANDLRGLADLPRTDCDGNPAEAVSRCRWIGGMLFLLALATDLPREPGCADDDEATPCDGTNLIEQGFDTFPEASLGAEQASFLTDEGVVGPSTLPACDLDCSMASGRRTPADGETSFVVEGHGDARLEGHR